jgi:adenine-specific DNA-methyltransferase
MTNHITKEQRFFQTLEDLFIGAKIEGVGGFINLMKIKSNYYTKLKSCLEKDINCALTQYPNFRDELFDKLYSFFHRYFTQNGSIYFNDTPFHNNVYERVYTNTQDVILFWKTHMLYYVKTDRLFRSITIELDNLKFYFDVSKLENKKANEKRTLIYELAEVKEDKEGKTIVFNVLYSEKGRITKTDDILKELKKQNFKLTEEELERAFSLFERQSEVDFFIHKNAKAFLQEQFKLWSYQYFWDGAAEWTSDRVNQLQILKNIAFKIIDFIAQFEDELVKIWNKPKFVKNANYVITLDRIKDIPLIEKILQHQNITKQIQEWQELGIVDENFNVADVCESDLAGKRLSKKYEHLPIDTKHFKDLELEILAQFEDLDKALDGWLIKSENYQALNTILPKFKEKVQTIYIDPPFNLDSSDQFLYRTNYKDANWATLLENRIRVAKDWLNEKGSIFVRCDYNGNWIVRCVMDEIFGKENFRNEIQVKRMSKLGSTTGMFDVATDSLFLFSKTYSILINQIKRDRICKYCKQEKKPEWVPLEAPGESKNDTVIINNKKFVSRKNSHWTFKQELVDEMYEKGLLRINEKRSYVDKFGNKVLGLPEYLQFPYQSLDSDWTDIPGYTSIWDFSTENSEILLKRVIESTSNEGDLVMDFFLGSCTTTAVAHKLGRKWIGVEMGEHFYTVVLPRMKKVLAYDKSGISKEVKEYQGGGFFKYYELEQYEEALANTVYGNHDMFAVGNKSVYEQYVFLKDERMLKALEIDYENEKIKVDLSKLYPNIDVAETISNLTGKWIKKITPLAPLQEGNYEVEFEDGSLVNTKDLDYKLIKPLIWWE